MATFISSPFVRHPWAAGPSMKRKSTSDDSPASKRPRYASSELSRDFNNLTLFSINEHHQDRWVPTIRPQPEVPPVKEIEMQPPSSWYEIEPNRIVVTDLEGYSDDEENVQENDDLLCVPPAVLNRLQSLSSPRIPITPVVSQALVLYKPLVIPQPPTHHANESLEIQLPPPRNDNEKVDAMDVEN